MLTTPLSLRTAGHWSSASLNVAALAGFGAFLKQIGMRRAPYVQLDPKIGGSTLNTSETLITPLGTRSRRGLVGGTVVPK